MSRTRVSVFSVPLAVVMVLLLAGSAMASITPVEVIGGKAQQFLGFGDRTWVTWTARGSSTQVQTLSNAFARPFAGGSTIQLNPANTEAFTGGFDPGTNSVIYQQIDLAATTNRSDLYFYDLDSNVRRPVTAVNTNRWEWGPRISSGFILFNLDYRKNGSWRTAVELYDRVAMRTSRLASWRMSRFSVSTGSVGETYATWTVCSSTCAIYVHDIGTGTTMPMPTRNDRPQYAPVVDETNARVYFVRSASMNCGRRVVVLRLPVTDLSQIPTRIYAMPDGIDIDDAMSSVAGSTGGFDLLFSRVVCRNSNEDVYRLPDVGSVPDGSAV
jgi:hypothetical protein